MIKMPQEGSQVRHVALSVNVEYAKSALGIMKVIQLFFLLITWAYLADSVCYGSGTLFGDRYGFYLFVTIFGSLSNTCIYVWFLLMLSEKIKLPAAIADGMILVLCFEIVWTLLLAISSSLMAEVAVFFGVLTHYQGGDALKEIYNNIMVAVIFGFFTIVLFVADIVILSLKIVKSRQAAAASADPTT